MDQQYDDG
jgi:WD40 repeat protein